MLNKNELEKGARVVQAMAHPLRLEILQLLSNGEMSLADLQDRLSCSQSMVSQQLKILEAQSLVSSRKEGTRKFCRVSNPDFLQLFNCLTKHLNKF